MIQREWLAEEWGFVDGVLVEIEPNLAHLSFQPYMGKWKSGTDPATICLDTSVGSRMLISLFQIESICIHSGPFAIWSGPWVPKDAIGVLVGNRVIQWLDDHGLRTELQNPTQNMSLMMSPPWRTKE